MHANQVIHEGGFAGDAAVIDAARRMGYSSIALDILDRLEGRGNASHEKMDATYAAVEHEASRFLMDRGVTVVYQD